MLFLLQVHGLLGAISTLAAPGMCTCRSAASSVCRGTLRGGTSRNAPLEPRCSVIHAFRASARVQFYDSRFYERAYFCRKVHSAVLGGNCGSTKANISEKRLYESEVLGKLFCANEVLRNERLLESAVLRNVPLRECGFQKKTSAELAFSL